MSNELTAHEQEGQRLNEKFAGLIDKSIERLERAKTLEKLDEKVLALAVIARVINPTGLGDVAASVAALGLGEERAEEVTDFILGKRTDEEGSVS